MTTELDHHYIRSQFPALAGDWTFFDNAGGTQTARQVVLRLNDYLYNTNVQLGASYEISALAGQRVLEAQSALAGWINAADPAEVVLGPSTTQLLQNLSKSLVQIFSPGDEVIVTDCDHEANIGPWIYMERHGIRVKTWNVRHDTLRLHLEDLEPLMTDKTRLVAFTHVSNIMGTIHPVKEFIDFIHDHGALACVDGVAAAPHRRVDVRDLGADFYVFSLYKVFGPHYALLYVKKEIMENLPGINHFFIGQEQVPYKLQPGHVNFELASSLHGVIDYFHDFWQHHGGNGHEANGGFIAGAYRLIAIHEEELSRRLLGFLNSKEGVRIIGETSFSKEVRVPTISFVVEGMRSDDLVRQVDPHFIGIRYGDFYARRLIETLGLAPVGGVVRVSMVHYNTLEEADKLIGVLDGILR